MILFLRKKRIGFYLSAFLVSILFFYGYTGYSYLTSGTPSGKTVIIDPGHGGEDGGAVGKSGSLEKELNLAISLKLRDILAKEGFQVVMTRETDVSLHAPEEKSNKKRSDLNHRVYIAREHPDALFISIHMNSYEQSPQKGAQVFYSRNHPASQTLAEGIQASLKEHLDPQNRRMVKKADNNIFLMKTVENPACLVECGFISHAEEEALLKTQEYQQRVAEAILHGIEKFTAMP